MKAAKAQQYSGSLQLQHGGTANKAPAKASAAAAAASAAKGENIGAAKSKS